MEIVLAILLAIAGTGLLIGMFGDVFIDFYKSIQKLKREKVDKVRDAVNELVEDVHQRIDEVEKQFKSRSNK